MNHRVACRVFALSLVLKLAAVAYMNTTAPDNLVVKDTTSSYRPLALSLLGGEGYQLRGSHAEATRIAPLFPLFLASVYALVGPGAPVWIIGVLNSFLRAGTSSIVYLLGCRLLVPRAGLLASLVHALDPWEAFWVAFVGKDSLSIFLFTCGAWALISCRDSSNVRSGVIAGVTIGLATLARYASIGLLGSALLVVLWDSTRGRLRRGHALALALAISAGALAALAPWLVRNHGVVGEPVLSTHFLGRHLYVGNARGLERGRTRSGYAEARPEGPFTRTVEEMKASPTQRESVFLLGALDHVTEHPWDVGAGLLSKGIGMWRPTFQGASVRNQIVLGVPYCVFMVLAAVGIVGSVRARHRVGSVLVVIAFYTALHVLLLADIRFRMYLSPLLALFAGWALHEWSLAPRARLGSRRAE